MTVRIHRFLSGPDGTFGVLTYRSRPRCLTLENPWFRNARNISCIPRGAYECAPHNGEKYRGVWRLENVPGRTGILIHAGNTINDTEGCILVGRSLKEFDGLSGVADSQPALEMLRRLLPEKFSLVITGPEGFDYKH